MLGLFVDRDDALEVLKRELSEAGFRAVIIYGRRRIGKTWLATALLRHVKGHYLFVPEGDEGVLLRWVTSKLKEVCGEVSTDSWEGIVKGIVNCANRLGGMVLVIDEFQRLGKSFASHLQALVDTYPDAPLKLVLLGSAVSVIERLAGPLGPLYGRCVTIKLGGFGFLESYVYLRGRIGASEHEAFRLYALFGGTPYNLALVESTDYVSEALKHIHSRYGRLYEEPLHLLASETRELGVYASILAAIASGRNSFSKLAQVVRRTSLIKYLEVLRGLGLVKRVVPAGENPLRTKKAKYLIADPFWDYWFKAIYPKRDEAEVTGQVRIDNELLRNHLAQWFEEVVRELLSKTLKTPVKPWWSKEAEIDAVAVTEEGAMVYEVKYAKVDEISAERELRRLKAKARLLPYPIIKAEIVAKEVTGNPRNTVTLEQLMKQALRVSKVSVTHI